MTATPWKRDFQNDFDFFDPEFAEHKDQLFEHLAAQCPVARGTDFGGFVALNSYEEVRKGFINWEELSSERDGTLLYPMGERQRLIPMELDPPLQQEWRHVLNPYFTAAKVAAWEPKIREIIREQIAQFSERGSCDIVKEFSANLPGLILFRTLVLLAEEDIPEIRHLMHEMVSGAPEARLPAHQAVGAIIARNLAARRELPPQGDVVDAILNATIGGEPISFEEQLACVMLLVGAGSHTTNVAVASGIHYFIEHPDHRKRILDEPQTMQLAIEEVLRLYPPANVLFRRAKGDIDLSGVGASDGQIVFLCAGVANRDPAVYPTPAEFHIDDELRPHLSFGVGVHRCIGSHLGRLVMRVVFEEIFTSLEDLELAGTPEYVELGPVRDAISMPVTFTPRTLV